MPSALAALRSSTVRFSQSDHDLVARDWESAQDHCARSHCERVWLRLSPDDRASLRASVAARAPLLAPHASLLERACLEELGRIIREAGCSPLEVRRDAHAERQPLA